MQGVRFKDGREITADLVVMAVGIRPNTELAEKAGLHCERGIVVNDTMQTYDPRIYAVGECVQHRGIAYGLVAPLFEQAKVCANHLAQFGIGRYEGSVTSTKLKVTGIDLFSAGDFTGGDGTEEIVLQDPGARRLQEARDQGQPHRAPCMYGDTVDGAWYFQLLRDGTDVADIRDKLMFGQAHLGDAGHGDNKRAWRPWPTAPRSAAATACARATIVKAIIDKKLFTLEEVRKHTKASSSCGSCTGLVETAAGVHRSAATTPPRRRRSRCAAAPNTPTRGARGDPRAEPADDPGADHGRWNGKPRTAAPSAARRSTTTCSAPGPAKTWTTRSRASSTNARTPTSRRTAPTR